MKLTLTELRENRIRLRKYDELKSTLKELRRIKEDMDGKNWESYCPRFSMYEFGYSFYLTPLTIDVLISAMESEIKKMEEE